jgi:hypothetical protein
MIVRAKFNCTVQTVLSESDIYSRCLSPKDVVVDLIMVQIERELRYVIEERMRREKIINESTDEKSRWLFESPDTGDGDH